MSTATPDEIIREAQEAGLAAAKAQFEKMGHKDGGWCGGYILTVDRRTAFAKRLMETGQGHELGAGISLRDHADVPRVQNKDLNVAVGQAMKAVLEKHGVRITEARSYDD